MDLQTVEAGVRRVLAEQSKLTRAIASIPESASLYDLGLTSHATVRVMLGLEDAFSVEFPVQLLRKSTFATIGTMTRAIQDVLTTGTGT